MSISDSRQCHQSAADGFGDCVQIVKANPLTLACRFGVLYLARCRDMTRVAAEFTARAKAEQVEMIDVRTHEATG